MAPAFCLLMFFPEGLDLNVNSSRQVELHQRIHRLLRWLENVKQALMSTNFESLSRLLVHVRRTQHTIFVLHCGQRNGPGNLRTSAPRGLHDLSRGLVEHAVVVCLQTNANSIFSNHVFLSAPSASPCGR